MLRQILSRRRRRKRFELALSPLLSLRALRILTLLLIEIGAVLPRRLACEAQPPLLLDLRRLGADNPLEGVPSSPRAHPRPRRIKASETHHRRDHRRAEAAHDRTEHHRARRLDDRARGGALQLECSQPSLHHLDLPLCGVSPCNDPNAP